MKKVDEAEANFKSIDGQKLDLKVRVVSRGDVVVKKTNNEAERLFNHLELTIPRLKCQLPVVENNPKYEFISTAQLRMDRAFDRFLKSYLVPDSHFRSRNIDLDGMTSEWEKVLRNEDKLAHLYGHVLPIGAQLKTGKMKKGEKMANEKKTAEALLCEIESLRGAIFKILETEPSTISGKSLVITPQVVSNWQVDQKSKVKALLDMPNSSGFREIKFSLEEMLENAKASVAMIEEHVLPTEIKLSQMLYWVAYIMTSAQVNWDLLDSAMVLDFQKTLSEASDSLHSHVPDRWVNGVDWGETIADLEKFIAAEYKAFKSETAVREVIGNDINWGWVPGYNETEGGPFLPDFAKTYAARQKPGLPDSGD